MNVQLTNLLDALSQAAHFDPSDALSLLPTYPKVGDLPSPWETWTLIGLVRHRRRQLWVQHVVDTQLGSDSARIGGMGLLGHPDHIEPSGTVPGMPEWEYYFHGCGCCLSHKVTGESIDVDFHGSSAEYFDFFFYQNYLESLRHPEPPEQRLLALHRNLRPISLVKHRLVSLGALSLLQEGQSGPSKIADSILEHEELLDAFCDRWESPERRLGLAALVGDWLAADELSQGQPELQRITRPRAEQCRSIRRQQLEQATGYEAADALLALSELGNADKSLIAALRSPPSGRISSALEIIQQQDDAKWCPHVYALFRRVSPDHPIPEPSIWMKSLKFLLTHNYQKQALLSALEKCDGTVMGEGVLLALENAPDKVLPLVRKGLLHQIPICRTEVAAILATINQPWSRGELLRALEISDEQEMTADVRAALLETGNHEAEKAVLAWETKNPHEDETGSYLEIDGRTVGPFYSMSEIMLKNKADYVRYEMQEIHERVMKIRNVVPPESPAPRKWWRFWNPY